MGCAYGDGGLIATTCGHRRRQEVVSMTKNHGNSVKNDKQYEGLRKKEMSKERAAKISNSKGASSRGGKKSGGGKSSS